MAEQFEYRGYQLAYEIAPHTTDDETEWHATIYIRENENAKTESADLSPPDKTAGEAKERAIRVLKSLVDEKLAEG